MDFMLAEASRLGGPISRDPEAFFVEHKYDGIRSQAHAAEGPCPPLYARDGRSHACVFPNWRKLCRTSPGAPSWMARSCMAERPVPSHSPRYERAPRPQNKAPAMLAESRWYSWRTISSIGMASCCWTAQWRSVARFSNRHSPASGRRYFLSPQYAAPTTADVDRLFAEARDQRE